METSSRSGYNGQIPLMSVEETREALLRLVLGALEPEMLYTLMSGHRYSGIPWDDNRYKIDERAKMLLDALNKKYPVR